MDPQVSLLPLAAVGVPIITALVLLATRRVPALRDLSLVVGAIVTFACVVAMLPQVADGRTPTTSLGELIPGVELSLAADGMGMVFAVLASLLWILAGSYAIGYLRGDGAEHQTRFYVFYSLCLSTAFGVAFAGDLFTFFIFYELLTVTTYPLVTHKGDGAAVQAGRLYLGYLLTGGAAVLLAMLIVYAGTGELAFAAGGFVTGGLSSTLIAIAFVLFALGFGTKAGLMPFHAWLPAAMVAPTPVSALLHAVAVVKAGVFAFGRMITFVFGPEVLADLGVRTLLSAAAAITIVVASIVALRQDHLKRRLAYSTIAHLAYIVLGFSLLTEDAVTGSLLHIVNHGVLKITLFFCAGAIHIAAHKDHVSELDGIGRRMPFTMVAFGIAAYGLAGLPPMGGFLSKFYLVSGAIDAGQYVLAGVMVFSGLFTAGYLFPIVYRAFFRPERAVGEVAVGEVATATAGTARTTAADGGDGIGETAAEPEPVGAPPQPTGAEPEVVGAQPQPTSAELTGAHPQPAGSASAASTSGHHAGHGEASPLMVVPLCVTAGLGLLLGLGDLSGVYAIAADAAASVTGGDR